MNEASCLRFLQARSARSLYLALIFVAICCEVPGLWVQHPGWTRVRCWRWSGWVWWRCLRRFVGDYVADAPACHGEGFAKTVTEDVLTVAVVVQDAFCLSWRRWSRRLRQRVSLRLSSLAISTMPSRVLRPWLCWLGCLGCWGWSFLFRYRWDFQVCLNPTFQPVFQFSVAEFGFGADAFSD